METNENTFNFGTAAEASPQLPPSYPIVEKVEVASTDNSVPSSIPEESAKKNIDCDHIPKEDGVKDESDKDAVVNEHAAVNNKEQLNCEEPQLSDSTVEMNKPVVHNSEPVHNQVDNTNGVSGSEEAKNEPEVEPTNVPSEPVELMDQDEKEKNATEETPKPDSTPNNDVPNDVQHSEDEMKVEEVSGEEEQRLEAQEDKREERTAEPLIEEPQEVVMKEEEEVDGPVDQTETELDSKDKVEISDVTEKEQPVEEKKTDEELLIDHINTAYQCLDDFMKTQDEVKIKDCMTLLSEIKTLAGKTVDSLKVFTAVQKDTEKGHASKKGKRSKSSTKVSKSTSKTYKNDIGGESDTPDPFEEVNLKEIKGLAVFAKWPNSGWFYPGIVRDLALADLKSGNQNLTVTFYDGLERDMKSINIFPAELIPTSSVLFDLDEETDLTVTGMEREDNWVKYVLTMAGQTEQVTKDFDKMAIKGAHMKTIKQAVDNASPDAAHKTENIVTGRRARGKSSLFNEDYVSSSSPRSTEKRKSKVEDSKSTPSRAPAKRKSNSKDDESGDSTPSRNASKRRQVNGTKSTPRRAAKK